MVKLPKISKECLECKKLFHKKNNYDTSISKFCSNECRFSFNKGRKLSELHKKRISEGGFRRWKDYIKVEKECLQCGKMFSLKDNWATEHGKYCSTKCYSLSMIGNGEIKIERKPKKCKQCGELFSIRETEKITSFTNRKYCSRKCFYKGICGENNPNWNENSFIPYPTEFNNELREKVRKRDNYTCQECNYPQEKLGYQLSVHHIDYDKNNSSLSNLISLCKSCHCQTNYTRHDWTNYFLNKLVSA